MLSFDQMEKFSVREVLLALGGNQPGSWGPPAATLRRARLALADAGLVSIAVSRLYRTAPVGGTAQAEFLNAVLRVRTNLPPGGILRLIKQLERRAGRRPRQRWGPRPLDIDILADAGRQIGWTRPRSRAAQGHPAKARQAAKTVRARRRRWGQPAACPAPFGLIVPHASLHLRAFVLIPLLDVAPDWSHPVLARRARTLLQALGRPRSGVRVASDLWP